MQNVLITGSSSGFGWMMAQKLASEGLRVFASMRDINGKNKQRATQLSDWAADQGHEIVMVELDVQSETSVNNAIEQLMNSDTPLDAIIHNAGHMALGPAEAFSAEQLAQQYDVNVLGAHRINRVLLPYWRKLGRGYMVWIGSSSTRGGTPPFLAPYFAAKAAMDALAQSYALELSNWGVETSIVVPGAFSSGTNHFANAQQPDSSEVCDQYWQGAYNGVLDQAMQGLAALQPQDAEPETVAEAVAELFKLPFGQRPFRIHIDPAQDGAEVVNAVADRVRNEMLYRLGLETLLSPKH